MSTVTKKFSLIFALIIIVAAFSIPVSAAPSVVTSGSVKNYYDYVLYSDGELRISFPEKISGTSIQLKKIPDDYLKQVKSITFDLANYKDNYFYTFALEGNNCPATKIHFAGSEGHNQFSDMLIRDFPDLKAGNITFTQGSKVTSIQYDNVGGITNLDFLTSLPGTKSVRFTFCANLNKQLVSNCKSIDEFIINYCDIEKLDLSSTSFKNVNIGNCNNIKEVYFPDGCKEVYVAYNPHLKNVYLPATLERVYKDTFSKCDELTDIFFYGSKTQFDNIKTFELGSYSEIKYGDPITGLTGNARVHCLNGAKQGWAQDQNGTWFYLAEKRTAVTGWKNISGSWYFFDEFGSMLKGWQEIYGTWYYLGDSGSMKTGWQSIKGKWYYFENSGAMVTGWRSIGGVYYYFKSGGDMASNEYCGGYWLSANGAWTYKHKASWKKDSTGWWYGDDTGWYAKNESVKIDGKVYNFNAAGYCTNP